MEGLEGVRPVCQMQSIPAPPPTLSQQHPQEAGMDRPFSADRSPPTRLSAFLPGSLLCTCTKHLDFMCQGQPSTEDKRESLGKSTQLPHIVGTILSYVLRGSSEVPAALGPIAHSSNRFTNTAFPSHSPHPSLPGFPNP